MAGVGKGAGKGGGLSPVGVAALHEVLNIFVPPELAAAEALADLRDRESMAYMDAAVAAEARAAAAEARAAAAEARAAAAEDLANHQATLGRLTPEGRQTFY